MGHDFNLRQCYRLSLTHREKTVCIIADREFSSISCGIEKKQVSLLEKELRSAERKALKLVDGCDLDGGVLYLARMNAELRLDNGFEKRNAEPVFEKGVDKVCILAGDGNGGYTGRMMSKEEFLYSGQQESN